jgi:hypothetical protein
MRTFKIAPAEPGQDAHHLWVLIATEDDGATAEVGTYETMKDAESAKAVLERQEVDVRS